MSYEASKAARLISWSNEKSGAERLSEQQLRDWVDVGVASLEWDDIWEEEKYIDFRAMISLRLISQLYARGVSVGAINESGSRSGGSWAWSGLSPARPCGVFLISVRLKAKR